MADALRLALVIAAKDVRAELRNRTALLSASVFAALVLVIFYFSRDPTAVPAIVLAPSVLWVTFAFAAIVALNRAFTVEREHGAIDGLLLAPVPRGALFLVQVDRVRPETGRMELQGRPVVGRQQRQPHAELGVDHLLERRSNHHFQVLHDVVRILDDPAVVLPELQLGAHFPDRGGHRLDAVVDIVLPLIDRHGPAAVLAVVALMSDARGQGVEAAVQILPFAI